MTERKAYEKRLQAEWDEWAAEIKRLKAKAQKAEADTRIRYDEEIKELEELHANAKKRLDQLKSTADDEWGKVKTDLDAAWGSAATAVRSAIKRF